MSERRKQKSGSSPAGVTGNLYDLSRSVGEQLRQRGLTLAVAESCTGGMLASQIVAVAGSSDYFQGGVIAYSNQIKIGLLNVMASTLAEHGAVSWQTAVQMAWGVLHLVGADVSLSTTGIAGPTGGTPTKPVGLVYIGLATTERAWWERHRWSGSRGENNVQSVQAALSLLQHYLQGQIAETSEGQGEERGSVARPELPAQAEIPISVEFTVREDGSWLPLAFHWRGQRCLVDNWGRSWQDTDGGQHYLVMSHARGTFELYFDPLQGKWYVHRAWSKPLVA